MRYKRKIKSVKKKQRTVAPLQLEKHRKSNTIAATGQVKTEVENSPVYFTKSQRKRNKEPKKQGR